MATTKKVVKKAAATKKAIPQKVASKPTAVAKTTGPNAIFNIDELNQILQAVNHSEVNELRLQKGDFKITIRQGGVVTQAPPAQQVHAPAPVLAAPQQAAPIAPAAEPVSDNLITIKSPMIGTFYRSAGPGKPVFVNVGDDIKVGQVLCIVEAMKLFNEIESEMSGKIVKVLIDDNSPVEYDQPLFLVQP
jgi:acetyl-CoA carboxylase biotin carboxyl carrier protein